MTSEDSEYRNLPAPVNIDWIQKRQLWGESQMISQTSSANMESWMSSQWIFASEHIPEIVVPPPSPVLAEEILSPGEYEELMEDLATARRLQGEYADTGVEDTISYNEYRARRLGTES